MATIPSSHTCATNIVVALTTQCALIMHCKTAKHLLFPNSVTRHVNSGRLSGVCVGQVVKVREFTP